MEEPLISVIVPVYNVDKYLERCVQSIVGQTYENLEILLIDDGSSDLSGQFCDAWSAKDYRILVIHKQNGGQSEARNYGLDLALGDYIGFVDSDDFVVVEMYRILYREICKRQSDMAECRMVQFEGEPSKEIFNLDNQTSYVFETKEIVRALLDGCYFTDTVPNMLIKSEIAKSVHFEVGKIHEDILWPYRVLVLCKRAVLTDKVLYAYYQRQGSTMLSAYSSKRFDGLNALQQRAEEVKKQYPDLYPKAERIYVGVCMYQYQYLDRQPRSDEYDLFMNTLHKRFCAADLKSVMRITGPKYKFWYFMFFTCPHITAHVRNMLKVGL